MGLDPQDVEQKNSLFLRKDSHEAAAHFLKAFQLKSQSE